ncbi:MAG TPA: D-alanyl-D-alanine carboxypeptidase/D-alanyl-D-alanine-endopeptidase [Solirubrobacterales bacterium]|nr:D-alanyl-D-alanine carboxypeptidase/D-alanyl-D-alanine-endopeptidase [Solirubrobacterales bacterium]
MRSRLVRGGGSSSGLLVVDAATGKTLCARAPGRPRPLASNMKLFTTSTALARLGAESHIATLLKTDGGIDRNGVLHGSLYLVGAGDPTLGTPSFYRRFLGGLGTNIFQLKRQVREAGISSVTGRLYADDSVFDRLRGVADSGYATSPEIGPLSGLSFNSGYSTPNAYGFATDPALAAAGTLVGSLREAGVRISPSVALGTAPASSTELARVESPPLTNIVNTTDVYSDNFFAEMLIKLLGARFGGAGTTAAGAKVVEAFARGHESGVHAVDGSGLTRSNRASPAAVVGLLKSMRDTAVGDEFIQDLALTGHEGTVADRMHGTAAYGRCRTKTGTIRAVSNLSGYCFNRSGRVIIFSILMAGVRDLGLAHLEQDLIAAEVASY